MAENVMQSKKLITLASINDLKHEHLFSLIEKDGAVAIKAKALDPSVAKNLAKRFQETLFKPYEVEKDFWHLGMPLFEARDRRTRAKYHREAAKVVREIRRATAPVSPADLASAALREAWPPGVRTLYLDGRACASVIARSLKRAGNVDAHVDDPVADTNFHPDATSIITTFSGLTYLDTPRRGGEVRLWAKRLSREEEQAARRLDSAYALDEAIIGPPALVLAPSPGDFLIFVASRPHAVGGFKRGRRITVSSFYNFHGIGLPLSIHA